MRKIVLPAVALAGLLALSGCSAIQDIVSDEPIRDDSGEVTAASTEDVFSLAVGDCLNSAELGETVEQVPFIPCDEPHDSEVYAQTLLTEDAYPGDDVVAAEADEFCYGEFEAFVGMAYDDSELDYFPMYPLEQGWNEIGDREVLCLVYDYDGGVTGTMAGAAR